MLRFNIQAIKSLTYKTLVVSALALSPAATHAQSIPTTTGWYQIPNSAVRQVCPSGSFGNCQNVTAAWNGGAVDSSRNRLIVWGGGHTDYSGNELYAVDLNTLTTQRLTDPGTPTASGCTDAIANGTQPNSRHTYSGVAYMSNVDRLFINGGSLACSNGSEPPGSQVWTYNFAATGTATKWQQMNPKVVGTAPQGTYNGKMAAYDPVSGWVFLHDRANLYSYDFPTNTLTLRNSSLGVDVTGWDKSVVVDPDQGLFLIIGGGEVYSYTIKAGTTYAGTQRATSGSTGIVGAAAPGLAYDPVGKRVVAWSGGNTVYFLNTQTWQWTSQSFSGGPASIGNGTYGRFGYVPGLDVFVTYNAVDASGATLRLSAGGTPTLPPSTPNPLQVQ